MEKELRERYKTIELNKENIIKDITNINFDDYNDFINQLYIIYRFVAYAQHFDLIYIFSNTVLQVIDKVTDNESLAKAYSIVIAYSSMANLVEQAIDYGMRFESIINYIDENATYSLRAYSALSMIYFYNGFYKEAVKYMERLFLSPTFKELTNEVKASQYLNFIVMKDYVNKQSLYEKVEKELQNLFKTVKNDEMKALSETYLLINLQMRNNKALKENNNEELERIMVEFDKNATFELGAINSLIQELNVYTNLLKTFFKFEKYEYVASKCELLIEVCRKEDINLINVYRLLIASLEKMNKTIDINLIMDYNKTLSSYYDSQMSLKKKMVKKTVDLFNLEAKIKRVVRIDPLTNCFNRRYLDEFANKNNVKSVIYCDIDNFKKINDEYGHKVGDTVLILLVDIINKFIPKKSTLFRMGGDEFVIISTYDNLEDNHELMEQIRNELANNKSYGKIDFSYGIYVNNLESPCSLYEMIDHADAIMYKNKAVHKMESNSLEF